MKISPQIALPFASFAALFLASCAMAPPPTETSQARGAFAESTAAVAPRQDRPGLGTGWGETRRSRITDVPFRRATGSRPLATATIFYNDAEGVREMVGTLTPRFARPPLPSAAASLVTVELRDQSGRLLPGLEVDDRWLVIGEQGRRYSIVVRNRTGVRIEAVLSVDGRDVIDGRAASFSKRGYVLGPYERLEVEGFRQSSAAVAAFRFSSVRDSYANRRHGDTRNVGVIGVALFHEYGTDPSIDGEAERRLRADPFPGSRFATPPEPVPIRVPRGR